MIENATLAIFLIACYVLHSIWAFFTLGPVNKKQKKALVAGLTSRAFKITTIVLGEKA